MIDTDLLETYSSAVTAAVRKVRPAVVHTAVAKTGAKGGSGSGFVITPDGYVLTNSHVVSKASSLVVSLPDGPASRAQPMGDDSEADLSAIRLDGPLRD